MRNLHFVQQARFLSRSLRDINNYIARLTVLKRNIEEILRQIDIAFRDELEFRNEETINLRRNAINTLRDINFDIVREENRVELFNTLLNRIPFG